MTGSGTMATTVAAMPPNISPCLAPDGDPYLRGDGAGVSFACGGPAPASGTHQRTLVPCARVVLYVGQNKREPAVAWFGAERDEAGGREDA
jgi:hypothetical protein